MVIFIFAILIPTSTGQRVFYVGLQKSGTNSFHTLMQNLGLRSLHNSGHVYSALHVNGGTCGTAGGGVGAHAPDWQPDYLQVLIELGPQLHSFINESRFQAFADHPWPLLFRYLDTWWPDSKFVIWNRNSTEWAASAIHHFEGLIWNHRFMFLDYGVCFKGGFNRPSEYADQLRRVADAHKGAVHKYFTVPHRASRFLEVDYSSATAARQVCEHVLPNSAKCAGLTYMPHTHDSNAAQSRKHAASATPVHRSTGHGAHRTV